MLREEHTDQLSLLMASVPWGLFDSVMGLVGYDWENERLSNFLMWQRSYDSFSLHLILYANPQREDYLPVSLVPLPDAVVEQLIRNLPETLTGFGNGIQFMIVFNH